MLERRCEICNTIYYVKYRSTAKRTCSGSCGRKLLWKYKKREMSSFTCQYCGTIVTGTKGRMKKSRKYCSVKCMGLDKRKRKTIKCLNCKKEFEGTRGKFCSRPCVYEYKIKTGNTKRNGYWIENGYKVLYIGKKNGIKEHRKLMEDKLGRKLKRNEIVHHKDGDISNNDIDNLELTTFSKHSSYHRKKELAEGKKLFKVRL